MSSTTDEGKRVHDGEVQNIILTPQVDVEEALRAVKAGKANEVDIAALILSENLDDAATDEWTKEEDKRLVRKVDLRLIPIVWSLYEFLPSHLLTYA